MKNGCVLLGAGGHAKVLIEILLETKSAPIFGILDVDQARWGGAVQEVPVLGGDELLVTLGDHGVGYFVVAVGSTGDNRSRRRLFERACMAGFEPLAVVSPRAIVSRWATTGPGCQLLPGSVVNPGTKLGANVIVNTGAIVEHDCTVENHVHVASGARVASTVHIGIGAHVGVGATVRQGVSIGDGALVGAGAVVVRDVPPWTTVVGVPARPFRRGEVDR